MHEKIVIIGAGSVGQALYEYLTDVCELKNVHRHDPKLKLEATVDDADVIHITVPWLNHDQYKKMWNHLTEQIYKKHPLIIINSTIDPHFLAELKADATAISMADIYFSPTRGPENDMLHNISDRVYYYANVLNNDTLRMEGYLNYIKLEGKQFKDACALAYGKLMETTYFGLQISFTQMLKRHCDEQGWNFDDAYTEYQKYSLFQLDYRNEQKEFVPRPIFFPGKIGGKCVMQNLKIVEDNQLADQLFIDFMKESNEKVKPCGPNP